METSAKGEGIGKVEKVEFDASGIEYVSYGGEHHLPLIMNLVDQELSEPYSIFTYRYFVYLWPQLSFMVQELLLCILLLFRNLDYVLIFLYWILGISRR